MVPHNRETDEMSPHRSFKIKANFGSLRIGFVEPTIWKTWRKSGRINADAERFMVSSALILLLFLPCLSASGVHEWGSGCILQVQGFMLCMC